MSYFRATRASGTQAISSATLTEITFPDEQFDYSSVFASGRCTVPVEWNGEYGEFYAGVRFDADEDPTVFIQVSTDGGSNWATVACRRTSTSTAVTVSTGPVLLNTGDIYRVAIFTFTAATIINTATFFSGGVRTPLAGFFRARSSVNQSVANAIWTTVAFGTELQDADGVFASNQFTVPVAWNGKIGFFNCGLVFYALENVIIYLYKNPAGTPESMALNDDNSTAHLTMASGPLLLSTGDVYEVRVFSIGFSDVGHDPRTFFSGAVFDAPA